MTNGEITKIAYDGEEYTKVANDFLDAQTGDVFLNSSTGEYYEITIRNKDFYGIPHPVRFTNDAGIDDGYMRGCSVNPLYRKVAQTAPKVSAPFAEMVTDKVSAVESDVASLDKRVSALETQHQPDLTAVFTYRMRVKALTSGQFNRIHGGEVGRVSVSSVGYYGDDPYNIRVTIGEKVDYFRAQDLEAYTVEPPKKPSVGDIVVITGNSINSENDVGDIGKLTETGSDDARVQVIGGPTSSNWTLYSEMRHATDAEKAEYEKAVAQAEATELFTKAGRKPNELRKGDIIRVKNDCCANGVSNGDILEVTKNSSTSFAVVKGRYRVAAEIACFAEDRKDIAKGGR